MQQRVGIIVDGQGDYASLRKRAKPTCVVIKTDGPRGHSVDPDKIVTAARKQVTILKAWKCDAIVLMLDFEGRNISHQRFVKRLMDSCTRICSGSNIYVAVPNRMIENWYLADVEGLKKKVFIRQNVSQKNYEGTHGKDELKNLFVEGHYYNEVKHGPQLFAVIDFKVASQNSVSFKDFMSVLGSHLS